jgi:hypothetical protein
VAGEGAAFWAGRFRERALGGWAAGWVGVCCCEGGPFGGCCDTFMGGWTGAGWCCCWAAMLG